MDVPQTLMETLSLWLTTQGSSTVILLLILFWIHKAVPKSIKMIEDGYQRNAELQRRTVQTMAENTDRLIKIIEGHNEHEKHK